MESSKTSYSTNNDFFNPVVWKSIIALSHHIQISSLSSSWSSNRGLVYSLRFTQERGFRSCTVLVKFSINFPSDTIHVYSVSEVD